MLTRRGAFTAPGATGATVDPGPPFRIAATAGDDVAALTLDGTSIQVSRSGRAATYRQRDHRLTRIEPGVHEVRLGDAFLVTTSEIASEGEDFFSTGSGYVLAELFVRDGARRGLWELGDRTFRTASLDGLLAQRLAAHAGIAGATLVLGLLHPMEAESVLVTPLTRDLLEAGAASSPEGHVMMIVRAVDEAPGGTAVPEAVREVHHVACLSGIIGPRGGGLEGALTTYVSYLPRFLRGLKRIGAAEHEAIVREAIPLLVARQPRLEGIMRDVGIAPGTTPPPEALPSSFVTRWADAPPVTRIAAEHVARAFDDFVTDPSPAA